MGGDENLGLVLSLILYYNEVLIYFALLCKPISYEERKFVYG